MLQRPWLTPVVIIFWFVTSGWLVVEKVVPSLCPGAPPGSQAFYTTGNRFIPVAWTVVLNDRPMGWATSRSERTEDGCMEVESLLHFDTLSNDEVLPAWTKMLLRTSYDPTVSLSLDARGHLTIDPRGDLKSFSSTIVLPATADRVFLNGTIDAGEATVNLQARGMHYTTTRRLPNHIAIGDELSPQATLPGLYQGRKWTVPVYSPLRPGHAPIEILHAQVCGEESLFWDDKLVRVDVVHYRADPSSHHEPRCRLWVDRSGRVLKQESVMLGSKLVFVRRSDEAAERLLEGIDTVAVEGRPLVDAGDASAAERPESP
jgi:hypothetical protein